MYGLPTETIENIQAVLDKYEQVQEAIIYGSRAKGTARQGSDIDLALIGDEINLNILNKISRDLEELPIPYIVDLSIYNRIHDRDLIEHIERVGKVFYKNQGNKSC